MSSGNLILTTPVSMANGLLIHQLDVRVDWSLFQKWSLILYADIQNIYNHKTCSPDLLVISAGEPGRSYKIDPEHPDHYLMRYQK